jgi:WD40 repeat protein
LEDGIMLRCYKVLATLFAVAIHAPAPAAEPASAIPILMPDSPAIPGRERPDGLLCILGDDHLRLSGYPTRIIPTLDGARLFALSMSNTVDILDAKTLAIQESIRASEARVQEVAIAPDGKRFAVASLDGVVTLWDVSTTPSRRLQHYKPFDGSDKKDYWLNLSMTGGRNRFCVSADAGATVYEWTPDGLKTIFQRQGEFAFKPALISPEGSRLVLKSKNPDEVQLLDLSVSPARVIDRLDDKLPAEMVFKDDDEFLAASTGNEASYVVSIAGDKLKVLGPLNDVAADAFSSVTILDQGRICIANHRTRGRVVFDCSSTPWEVLQAFPFKNGQNAMPIGGSANGSTLYAVNDQMPTSFKWAEKEYTLGPPTATSSRALGRVDNLAFLRDGTLVCSTKSGVHAVALGEPTRPRPLDAIRLKTPLIGECYLVPHPTEREFAIINLTDVSNLIQIRDGGTGLEEIQRFTFGTGAEAWRSSPWSAGYSPDGSTLAVGFWDQTIELYSNGQRGLSLRSKTPNAALGHVCVLTFAPDGLALACGDFGNNARLYEYDGELKSHTAFPKFGDAVRHAQFSPDGGLLLLGSQNGEIRLIDLTQKPPTSRQLLREGENNVKPEFNSSGGVSSMQWVGDGKLMMTAKAQNGETRVVLWKMPSGEAVQAWTVPGWTRAAIDRDGFLVAVARPDGVVCIMQVSDEVQRWLSNTP